MSGDDIKPRTSPSAAVVAETTDHLAKDPEALARSYGPSGFQGVIQSGNVLWCAVFAAMGGFLFGYDQGLMSITLVMDHFNARFPRIDASDDSAAGFWKGLLTAMLELGAMLGAALAGWLADKFSRKNALFTGFCWFVVGSAIQTGSMAYAMLVVGRLVGGVGIGILSMAAPLYISEISPPNTRGAMLVLEEWSIVFGIIVSFYITYGTRFINGEWSFRLPFLLQVIPALVLMVLMRILPYSPRWLAGQGRDAEALANLSQLRGLPDTDHRVIAEWLDVRAEVIIQKEIQLERYPHLQGPSFSSSIKLEAWSWVDTFRRGSYKRTLTGIGLMFFQQVTTALINLSFVGINALIYYSPSLFKTLGLDYELQLNMSGVMNILQIVGVTPSFLLMDRIGRRNLLLFGSVTMTICHVVVAALVGAFHKDWASHSHAAWAGVAFIFIYMVCFGLSWGPVPWAMPPELFNSTMRAKGVALSTCSNWFNNFIIGLITPPLIQKSPYGAFAFFAVFSFLSGVWTWFFVPETARRTLEDMDAIWGDEAGKRDQERVDATVVRLEMELRKKN